MILRRKRIELKKWVSKISTKKVITQEVTNAKIEKQHYPQNSLLSIAPSSTCLYCLYNNVPSFHAHRSHVIKLVYHRKRCLSIKTRNDSDSINGWKMEPLGGRRKNSSPLIHTQKSWNWITPDHRSRSNVHSLAICSPLSWTYCLYMYVYFGGFFFTIFLFSIFCSSEEDTCLLVSRSKYWLFAFHVCLT